MADLQMALQGMEGQWMEQFGGDKEGDDGKQDMMFIM
jgi:hypothetical protein